MSCYLHRLHLSDMHSQHHRRFDCKRQQVRIADVGPIILTAVPVMLQLLMNPLHHLLYDVVQRNVTGSHLLQLLQSKVGCDCTPWNACAVLCE